MRKNIIFILILLSSLVGWSQKPYIVADFAEKDLPTMLEVCHQGGFETLVVKTPFSTYGHYEWNSTFAPEGDLSVRRMVQAAADEGITLGVLVQEDAITLNDAFFAPKYFSQYRHTEPLVLFDEMAAEDVDIALRRNDLFKTLSALNLLLIDEEMVSFGTMELVGDLVLLHHCTRGLYGTKRTAHDINAKVYRIWDDPEPFVYPEGDLLASVRQQLAERLEAGHVTLAISKGAPGQDLIEESIRVRQVERWDSEGLGNNTLGWYVVYLADKKRVASTREELEWMLSKAAVFQASYGLLLDPPVLKNHGSIGEMLPLMKQWNTLIGQNAFTTAQKAVMKDPYLDWHLERQNDSLFLLHPCNYSRRYQCVFHEADTGLLQTETWKWNAEAECRFGLRLQVDGEVEIVNPMINTAKGLVMFPCTVRPGQRLIYDFGETALVVDANGNILQKLAIEGLAELAQGDNEVSLFCEVDPTAETRPMVRLRYITREPPMTVHPHK